MTKQEAINELTRAAELCPTTPLAEACRMGVEALSGVAPTVDAVPVVRCKDCKHNPKLKWFGCPMASLSEKQRPEIAWCWKGERKDGEQP